MSPAVVGRPGRLLSHPVAAHTLVLLAVGILYLFAFRSVQGFAQFMDYQDHFLGDFILVWEGMGNHIFQPEVHPREGYFYSAFFAIVLGVICLPDHPWPRIIWGLLTVASTLGLWLFPLLTLWRGRLKPQLAYTLLFFLSVPVLHNFRWGQVSAFLLLLMLASAWFSWKRRSALAGMLLGTALAIKFYPLLVLGYFLIRRDWRSAVWTIATSAFLLAIVPSLVLGPGVTLGFTREVQAGLRESTPYILFNLNSQYLPSVIRRWQGLTVEEFAPQRPAFAVASGALFLGLIFLLVVMYLRSKADGEEAGRESKEVPFVGTALLSAGLPLVLITSWTHYLVHLPLLQVWLGAQLGSLNATRRVPLLVLLLASVVLTSLPFRLLHRLTLLPVTDQEDVLEYARMGLPTVANASILLACAGYLLLCRKGAGRREEQDRA